MNEHTQQYSDFINSLQSRIQALEDENRFLKERLDEAGVSYADIVSGDAEGAVEVYDPDQSARIKKFDVTDKIASDFFMMFCRGRMCMIFVIRIQKRGRTDIIRRALTAGIVAVIYRKRTEFVVRIANCGRISRSPCL